MTTAALCPTIRQLGHADYVATWQAMREFTAKRDASTDDELWIVEHPPVYTLGQAGRLEHVLNPGSITVIATDRGGQVTYHGPGQVVIYTLIDLRRLGIYVKELVYRIEESVIQMLAGFGVDGRRVKGAPGVYVPYASSEAAGALAGMAKIAALGIKVARGCSYHGVALNVAMDLEPFSHINPCGYPGLPAVDLAKLGVSTSVSDAGAALSERLVQHLSR